MAGAKLVLRLAFLHMYARFTLMLVRARLRHWQRVRDTRN